MDVPLPPSPSALAPVSEPVPRWWPLLAGGVVLSTLLPLALLFAPPLLKLPRYDVSGGQIVARSLGSSTVIPQGTPVEKVALQRLSRRYGSAAAGYVAGRFTSERGEIAVYGNGERAGLLFATRPPTFLTPADPDTLLTVWRGGGAATFRPAPVPPTANLGLAALLLSGAGLVAALFLSKPRVTYAVAGDTLTVRTRASTTTFARRNTRASLTADPLGVRLFGTSLPGYHTGTFATRSGNVQAAATTARPRQALILEHAGKRYYLTPGDPAAVTTWFEG